MKIKFYKSWMDGWQTEGSAQIRQQTQGSAWR